MLIVSQLILINSSLNLPLPTLLLFTSNIRTSHEPVVQFPGGWRRTILTRSGSIKSNI